jgi:asparagine synthetase B (glutamine-hydrolysing)
MCGIVGIYNPNSGVDVHTLKEMTNTLFHRGPDEEGYFIDSEEEWLEKILLLMKVPN